jgi:hypothetical protein
MSYQIEQDIKYLGRVTISAGLFWMNPTWISFGGFINELLGYEDLNMFFTVASISKGAMDVILTQNYGNLIGTGIQFTTNQTVLKLFDKATMTGQFVRHFIFTYNPTPNMQTNISGYAIFQPHNHGGWFPFSMYDINQGYSQMTYTRVSTNYTNYHNVYWNNSYWSNTSWTQPYTSQHYTTPIMPQPSIPSFYP